MAELCCDEILGLLTPEPSLCDPPRLDASPATSSDLGGWETARAGRGACTQFDATTTVGPPPSRRNCASLPGPCVQMRASIALRAQRAAPTARTTS